jgi:hypothetical protein
MKSLVFLFLFFLASCLPQTPVSRRGVQDPSTGDGATAEVPGSGTISETETGWNFLSKLSRTITINVSNLNNAYITGSTVESFLGATTNSSLINFTDVNYCVITDFSLGGSKLQLRTRAVPISFYNFSEQKTSRILRVDFDNVTNSTSLCSGTLYIEDEVGTFVADTSAPSTPVFSPASLCPTCTTVLNSLRVRLFKLEGGFLKEVEMTSLNVSSLSLTVDPNYSATGTSGSCSNSICLARGFNCCLENQCVNDGATRSSALTLYSAEYLRAEEEKMINPLAYLNYPHIYYVCGVTVPTDSSDTSGTTVPQVDYEDGLEQLKKDYYCVEHLKAQATTDPFHLEFLTKSYTSTTDCLTASGDSGQLMYYQEVVKRMYQTCGCSKTTLTEMLSDCPNYEYVVTSTDTAGNPTQIDCYTPPNVIEVPNMQTVAVNSRSAPHRFFDSLNGLERDILNGDTTYTLSGVTQNYTQEGDAFSYLDETSLLPVQENFGMNSILGQMTVTLDKALPAKIVNVNFDQVYIISTTFGYYTPCPTCNKDSWINSFSAFPSSNSGVGLQPIGHTTSRDELSTNYTMGNYEDTIFGRACWIPPTMIPFTHQSASSTKDQRLNRLEAQAALFINGYQRDWYGFNKGALIGSFDGVTWFAIGKGRIVKATSNRLFLAINAPFADLASPTLHSVHIQDYDGVTQAAHLDYDPKLSANHPYQNEAGNCQAYHMCEIDTDCITKLGWEYACADVRDVKTYWPSFDIDGNEKVGQTKVSIDQILQQKKFPDVPSEMSSFNTRRCVYRGAGAPCINNAGSISNLTRRKNLTCAPNFYCAKVSEGSGFNSKISRYAAPLEDIPVTKNHFYGRDANVLGRPLNYITISSGTSLPSDVQTAIKENLKTFESTQATSNSGICRPGKRLPSGSSGTNSNPYTQHASSDATRRADFISQISSCNAGLFNTYRYTSCPVIDENGNYEIFNSGWTASISTPTNFVISSRTQNACGLDTLDTSANTASSIDDLLSYSPFRNIESKPLSATGVTIIEPTFARDACFRRAGSVCHTDLDCFPNKMHADQVDNFPASFFGGSEAEQNFHREYLVCGQADDKPSPSNTTAFKDYKINQNRCCREVGKDLTTYTANVANGSTFTSNVSSDIDPATLDLKTDYEPGVDPTNTSLRYSRFATVEDLGSTAPSLNAADYKRNGGSGTLNHGSDDITKENQWVTLNEANSETCCGGGWVRKFADGSNDWSVRNRFFLDVSGFACINSMTVLLTDPDKASGPYGGLPDLERLLAQDAFNYCVDPAGALGNCAQFTISNDADSVAPVTDAYSSTIEINTITPDYTSYPDFFFMPKSADSDLRVTADYTSGTTGVRKNISIVIPSYVTSINTGTIQMVDADGTPYNCASNDLSALNDPYEDDDGKCPDGQDCCYYYDSNPSKRILKVIRDEDTSPISEPVGISFTANVEPQDGSGNTPRRFRPGSSTYYLERLDKLELNGIPQVYYEPLYCSDNYDRLVPGIFKSGITTRSDFTSDRSVSFSSGGVYYANNQQLEMDPIFAAHEFKCCANLGKSVNKMDKCCSGYGQDVFGDGSEFKCMLPPGTDLMVYFNRFVSNDGSLETDPGGGLVDDDFDPATGKPNFDTDVVDKIRALGNAYCNSTQNPKVRTGGVFGSFSPQPVGPSTQQGNLIFGIVDSPSDFGTVSSAGSTIDVGYQSFMLGFRWNNHLYCND